MKIKYAPSTGQTVLPDHVCDIGFEASASVRTPRGDVPARELRAGDIVLTRRGPRRLQNSIQRLLSPDQKYVRIKTDAFGCPCQGELVVLPKQRIVLRDWRARILFGQEIAAPPVSRLIDGENAKYESGANLSIQFLFLSQPEVIRVNGVELASADAQKK
ncbi:MAG: Hint domain-containing protein [Paracoccaceae bacterium]|nr:Hint domain-containing protein [Paracoccaceae bacterium]